MLYALSCIFCLLLCNVSVFIMPDTRDYKNSPLKIGAFGMREPDG